MLYFTIFELLFGPPSGTGLNTLRCLLPYFQLRHTRTAALRINVVYSVKKQKR